MDDPRIRNARAALEQLLELREGENFLVVSDDATAAVASAFADAGSDIGARVLTWRVPEAARPLAARSRASWRAAASCTRRFRGEAAEAVSAVGLPRGAGHELGEGLGILDGEVGEHLAVDLDLGGLQVGHQTRVGGAVLASGGGLLSPIMGAVVHNVGSVLVVISSASIAFASE